MSPVAASLVDEQHLAPVAGQVHLAGDPVQQQDVDHRMQVGRRFSSSFSMTMKSLEKSTLFLPSKKRSYCPPLA